MRWRTLRDRLQGTRDPERVAAEIHAELAHHEDLLAAELERGGMTAGEARREARRRVGNRAALQDRGYDVRGGGGLESFVKDIRYGFRALRQAPGFTLVALFTLALGIGANTAIFSVASGVLLRPLPYWNGDRLVMVWMDNSRIQLREDWHSYPNYADYRDRNTTLDGLAVFNQQNATFTGEGDPERILGAHSTANLFEILGAAPLMGRTYTQEEELANARVIVLSHGLWQRRFGGRADILGQTIELSSRPTTVIGVMPESFVFPSPRTQYWVPTTNVEGARTGRGSLWLQSVGVLKPGVSVAQAQADLDRIQAGILQEFPNQQGYGVYVVDYHEQLVGRVRPAILVLLGAVGFVLLIACTNVANLLLARAAVREREFALRAAIGAGRGRIIRQLLTESVLLAVLGGAAGLALGWFGLEALVALAPRDLPRVADVTIDGRVLAFTTGVALLTGVLFGLAPAWQTAQTDPGHAMKEGGRGSTSLGRAVRRTLVVAEVAMAVVLLVGAGLMIRSFAAMQRVDLGMNTENVLSTRLALLGPRYQDGVPRAEFFARLVERVKQLPGVEGAATVGTVFLSATPNSTNFSIEGRPDFAPDERIEVPVDSVTPDYFTVMGVPLLEGRFFDHTDTATSPAAVIVNHSMARQFFPDGSPVGRRIKYGQLNSRAPWMTIVGVVADTRRTGYESVVRPETYLPMTQGQDSVTTLVVRTTGEPTSVLPSVRAAVRELDPSVALQQPRALGDEVAEMTADRRLNTTLLVVFAIVAATLAAVGVYGVLSYAVEQRTRELGVRLALGASLRSVLGLVLAEGLTLAGIGLAIGLAGALAMSGAMTRLLYQVPATDPLTMASIVGVTAVVALIACAIPAMRAMRVDPVTALRGDQ
jgi:putative ABC transport system permease protein